MSESPQHVYVTWIRSTPEKVWEALTSPDWTCRYFHETRFESDLAKGAPVVYRMADGSAAVEGEVLEVEPNRRLVITWRALYHETLSGERPSRVTFELEPMGEVCKLTLVHDDFDGETETYKSVSEGWGAILCNLKTLLETGEPLRFPDA